MLSMKTLRVAIVAMGSALLLGPGSATAVDILLDYNALTDPAKTPPIVYAVETVGEGFEVRKTDYYPITAPDSDSQVTATVRLKRALVTGDEVYLRMDLSPGLVFTDNATPTLTAPTSGELISGGTKGMSYVVFHVPVGNPDGSGDPVTVDLSNDLAVAAETGVYSATVSAHNDPDDAIEGVGARSTPFAGAAPIVQMVNGLDVRVMRGPTAVAEVAVGFLWFAGPSAAQPLVAQKKLGWFSVAERQFQDGSKPLNVTSGAEVVGGDLVGEGGISAEVSGNMSVGAFSFVPDIASNAPVAATGMPSRGTEAKCPAGAADAPDRGELVDGEGEPLIGADGEAATADSGSQTFSLPATPTSVASFHDIWTLCLNVDILGKETNTVPVPNEDFTGTVTITGPDADEGQDAGTGTIGAIRRNGTSVNIAYLTVSHKYNQRLIISNRGSTPAMFDLGGFTTEDGTMVDLSAEAKAARAAGLNMVPAKGQLVLRVADLLEFTGEHKRAAATLSLNARSHSIQVATTQVNLEDGSTDTVLYESMSGTGL